MIGGADRAFRGFSRHDQVLANHNQEAVPITVAATDCSFHIVVGPNTKFTPCDRAKDFLTKSGLSFKSVPAEPGSDVIIRVGNIEMRGYDEGKLKAALKATGYPPTADPNQINYFMTELLLIIMVIYVTMVYGPIAAFLVELFPTQIRYTSMSLPYHIGNGWFGGMLPLLATAMVAASGDIYYGLWYPIIVSLLTLVVGAIFLRETKGVKIRDEQFA
jgi:hypothetical protein